MSEMTSLCYGYGRRVFQAETVVRVLLSKTSINSSEVEARSTRLHIRRVVLYSVNAYVWAGVAESKFLGHQTLETSFVRSRWTRSKVSSNSVEFWRKRDWILNTTLSLVTYIVNHSDTWLSKQLISSNDCWMHSLHIWIEWLLNGWTLDIVNHWSLPSSGFWFLSVHSRAPLE